MKKHLLFIFAALLPMLASAQTKVEIDGIWYNIIKKAKQAEVTYKGDDPYYDNDYSGSITIPATVTYDGVAYSVTSIGVGAFKDCSSLTAITLPEGVTSIGGSAFAYCSSLTAITIPEGVTSIGNYAFDNCTALKEVIFEDGSETLSLGYNEYYSYGTGQGLFYDCPLESVYLGRNLSYDTSEYYGYSPFYYKTKLTSVVIGDGVTSIGYVAFSYCSSLTNITVAEGNTKYDSRGGCNAIIETNSNTLIAGCSTTIIPESVTSIGNYAFYGCYSLTTITLPEGVTSIGDYAFTYCSSLTAITIPEGVTSIGKYAFYKCSSLSAITIPENSKLTSIRYAAFSYCSSLTAITLPESVTSIGNYAFRDCTALKEVIFEDGSETLSLGYNYYYSDGMGQGLFYDCPLESVYLGRNLSYNTSRYYGYSPFYDKTKLTSVVIGDGVTSIGNYAFSHCSSLTTINIPEGVTSIGNSAFYWCHSLTAITIPEGVTSIGEDAFFECSSLTAITLPEGVTSIGDYAFYKCSSLTTIVLPKSVEYIGWAAFANCSELLDVYCHAETVPSTANDAFNGSYIEYATLHVPASALEAYKTTSPWSNFGTIVSLTEEEMGIKNSELNIQNPELIYDLRGRRVEKAEKGIYIVNGKKVVIR